MQLLRTCLFGYGSAGAIGLAIAVWSSIVAGVLVAWLGGAVLSILWSLWGYRRHGMFPVEPSEIPAMALQDHPAPSS